MTVDTTVDLKRGPVTGLLSKMHVQHEEPVSYHLELNGSLVCLNEYLGKTLRLEFLGGIQCSNCGRPTKKSFSQGFCYPCMQRLARCDQCILKPETCHFDQGTCREPDWAQTHCFVPHIVYLANSSGLKVGITRANQMPTRWIDQGAVSALPIFEVPDRKTSGLLEVLFKSHVADKTNWRKMLKHDVVDMDLEQERDRLLQVCQSELTAFESDSSIRYLSDAKPYYFNYPHLHWPDKVVSKNFDKESVVEGQLIAVKGQYLIFDKGCLNIRKFSSYEVQVSLI